MTAPPVPAAGEAARCRPRLPVTLQDSSRFTEPARQGRDTACRDRSSVGGGRGHRQPRARLHVGGLGTAALVLSE